MLARSLKIRVQSATRSVAVLLAMISACVGDSHALILLSESAAFNPATLQVQFTMVFLQPPDFFTVDSLDRQAASFQYLIVGNADLPYPEQYDSIIRGEEIHISGTTLRVRNVGPPSPDLEAGGWGTVRGSVPFSLDGNVVTFATPLPLISNHSIDGHFAYRLETYEYGGLVQITDSQSRVVPEPATAPLLWIGALMFPYFVAHSRRQ